jgi:hypothetical protein
MARESNNCCGEISTALQLIYDSDIIDIIRYINFLICIISSSKYLPRIQKDSNKTVQLWTACYTRAPTDNYSQPIQSHPDQFPYSSR